MQTGKGDEMSVLCRRCGHGKYLHIGATECNGHFSTGILPRRPDGGECCQCEGFLEQKEQPDHELIRLHRKWVEDDDLSYEEVQDKMREFFRTQVKSGDTICQVCGLPNPTWFIDSKYWNLIVDEKVGILCLRCFAERAANLGVTGSWQLVPEPETNSLIVGKTPIQCRSTGEREP
jgi:hypothetical protein